MNGSTNKELTWLFQGLVDAAKSMHWRPSTDARIHHRESRGVEENYVWQAHKQETLRLVFPNDTIYHLQIRLERHEQDQRRRVIVFGRRVKSLSHATPNTQRATFNSDHMDQSGFWLRPNLDGAEKLALARRLPGPRCPRWDGLHVQLGSEMPYLTLRYFLTALAAIEEVKGGWEAEALTFEADSPEHPEFEVRDLSSLVEIEEGRVQRLTTLRRVRCQRLLGEAREFFRSKSPGGRLQCQICTWLPPVETRSEIIQIHHVSQLHLYPENGKRMTLRQALTNLVPLCPNCHQLLESHPKGGCYDLAELTKIVRSRTQ